MPYKGGGGGGGGDGTAPRASLETLARSLLDGTALCAARGKGTDSGELAAGGGGKKGKKSGIGANKRAGKGTGNEAVGSCGERAAPFELARWDAHPEVALVRFASMGAQRDALARASTFLEDAARAGTVVERLDVGRMGGAALYSGHNMRASEFCAFLDAAAVAAGGLTSAEEALRGALLAEGLLRASRHAPSGVEAAGKKCALLAIAAGAERSEVREALLHEAMHGLWYVCDGFRSLCECYYADRLDVTQRQTWLDFLGGLNYDVSNEELVANEFQAYMLTETVMWQRGGGGKVRARKEGEGVRADLRRACAEIES